LPEGAAVVRRIAPGAFVVVAAPNGLTATLIQSISGRQQVTRVEPNYPFFLQSATQARPPDDPEYQNQWGLATIHAERAWTVTRTTDIVVAVLDTGIDISHPDLAPNLWVNPLDTGKDEDHNNCVGDIHGCDFTGAKPSPLTGDGNGHGTHCAGTIGAVGNNGKFTTGVAWKASILGVRVLYDDLTADADKIVLGIDYAIAKKARIISASFGSYLDSTEVREAVDRAIKAGILIVAAAGNTEYGVERDNDRLPIYPASIASANVIAVMASDRSDNVPSQSRFGRKSIHLAAPGVSILSLTKGSSIGSKTGTSMAVPFVAGTAALLWALPGQSILPASTIAAAIKSGARRVGSMSASNSTSGILDMAFMAPKLTTNAPIVKPTAPAQPQTPPAPPTPKPVPVGKVTTWTGQLRSIFAAGGETSGFVLQIDGQRVELAGPETILNQLRALMGQTISVRGQLERVTSVERGAREQVRVTELVKK
jgi:subtilisin family serine protease